MSHGFLSKHTGIAVPHLSRLRGGHLVPSPKTLQRIIMGVDLPDSAIDEATVITMSTDRDVQLRLTAEWFDKWLTMERQTAMVDNV